MPKLVQKPTRGKTSLRAFTLSSNSNSSHPAVFQIKRERRTSAPVPLFSFTPLASTMEEEKGCFGPRMDDESFMEMLRSGEGEDDYVFSHESALSSPSSSSCCYSTASQMLWFGGREEEDAVALVHGKSTDSSLSSLSPSSPSVSCSRSSSRFEKKEASACGGRGTTARLSSAKKPKTEASAAPATIMVRKEKLGERIMALQQLVSPFGKSDTASVLHEALGYIRFLHEQVQVLSSAYLQVQSLPSPATLHDGRRERNDLRSRGLCLVPVAYTEHVAKGNGADLWSPAVGGSKCSSSSASSKQ